MVERTVAQENEQPDPRTAGAALAISRSGGSDATDVARCHGSTRCACGSLGCMADQFLLLTLFALGRRPLIFFFLADYLISRSMNRDALDGPKCGL